MVRRTSKAQKPPDEPEVSVKSEDPNSSVFMTPTIRRVIEVQPRQAAEKSIFGSPLGSPTRSPRKLDLIDATRDMNVLSPAVTPRGRKGRPSPARRSAEELNLSAQKRAWNTKISARLLDEDEADDFLNEQDLRIAERIIDNSRIGASEDEDEFQAAYGSDVELEEDLTEVQKRGRGRPRKHGVAATPRKTARKLQFNSAEKDEEAIDEDEVGSLEDDEDDVFEIDSDEDEEEEEVKEKEVEDELSATDDEFIAESPTKRGRGRPPKKRNIQDVQAEASKPKRATKVLSIFQRDDDEIFADRKSPSVSPQKSAAQQNRREVDWSLFQDRSVAEMPVISGISKEGEIEEDEQNNAKKESLEFQAFPVPRLNDDGSVPENFIEKYLKGIGFASEKTTNEVLDERAFFYEGTEGYFEQKSNRDQHSVKTLAQLNIQLDYDEFAEHLELMRFFKTQQREKLIALQKQMFHQWCFELSQGFNLALYGVGSKIDLLNAFGEAYVFDWIEAQERKDAALPNVLVINGYNPMLKLRDTARDIVNGLLSEEEKTAAGIRNPKLLSDFVPPLVSFMNKRRAVAKDWTLPKLILIIHNIDGDSMRLQNEQNYLAQLASLPEIWLIASIDNVNTPLMWDAYKQKNYSFIWHDVTSYEPYVRELSFRDMLKLGKSKKLSSGRGTKFVLNSLTANSKKLYHELLKLQMKILEQSKGVDKSEVAITKGNAKNSVKFKEIYHRCVDEFITSNEINFRTMLREFVEHNMCNLQKDESGTEIVFVPYTYDEMRKIIKEVFHK